MAIENKSFYTKPTLMAAFDKAKSKSGRLHFLGLVSGDPLVTQCHSDVPPYTITSSLFLLFLISLYFSDSLCQVSDGGVHSHITHLEALLVAAKQAGVPQSFVHFFSDGRDTSPVSGGECVCRSRTTSWMTKKTIQLLLTLKGGLLKLNYSWMGRESRHCLKKSLPTYHS